MYKKIFYSTLFLLLPVFASAQTPDLSKIYVKQNATPNASQTLGTETNPIPVTQLQSTIDSRRSSSLGNQPLTVYFEGGVHLLSETLKLRDVSMTTSDGALCGDKITFDKKPGTGDVYISGGKYIPASLVTALGSDMYSINLTGSEFADLFQTEPGSSPARELYPRTLYKIVTPMTRARHPDVGTAAASHPYIGAWWNNQYGYGITMLNTPALPAGAQGAQEFDVVMPMGWSISLIRTTYNAIAATNMTNFILETKGGELEDMKQSGTGVNGAYGPVHNGTQRAYYVGHPDFISVVDEWARVPGEKKLKAKLAANELGYMYVPKLQTLLHTKNCKNIEVKNVIFAHTEYQPPHGNYIGRNGADHYKKDNAGLISEQYPYALNFENGLNEIYADTKVTLDGIKLQGIAAGGIHASYIGGFKLLKSKLTDIGGNAIYAEGDMSGITPVYTSEISNNYIANIGMTYASDAIVTNSVRNMSIAKNTINNIGGRGAAFYDYRYFLHMQPPNMYTNSFVQNRVKDTLQLITDAGSINTAGSSDYNIHSNIVKNTSESEWNTGGTGYSSGVYVDIGSSHLIVYNNKIEMPKTVFNINCQYGNNVSGNQYGALSGSLPVVTSFKNCGPFYSTFRPPLQGESEVGTVRPEFRQALTFAGCTTAPVDNFTAVVACTCNDTNNCPVLGTTLQTASSAISYPELFGTNDIEVGCTNTYFPGLCQI